jgi:uncharacterized protein YyaL (SSP411 family)
MEYTEATGEDTYVADIRTFLDQTNNFLFLFGNYLPADAGVGMFALGTYGSTTITAAVALLNLQYAMYVEGDDVAYKIDRARTIVSVIDRKAFDGERYLFEPDRDKLYLYPNAMMMLVMCRLYELTGERRFLDRAVTVADAISPLRDAERGGYNSPYSAEYMGAKTSDYSTLSSQNYIALAFAMLYKNTLRNVYFDESVFILNFVRERLYSESERKILHHWMDGRIAIEEDREYFCSGCNLQFLYVTWFLADAIPEA